MTATITPSFGTLLANPILKGKQIKEGIHIFHKHFMEDMLNVGESTIITNSQGERLITSPVEYWELIEEKDIILGIIVTMNSIYKVCVR